MKPPILHIISACLLVNAAHSTSSQPPKCTSDLDCQLSEFCDDHQQVCLCLDNHQANPNQSDPTTPQRCLAKKLIDVNSSEHCTASSQCALFAECHQNRCKCASGVATKMGNTPWQCQGACSTDADCAPFRHFECRKDGVNSTSTKYCHCKKGFWRDPKLHACVRVKVPLGQRCSPEGEKENRLGCGNGAVCSEKLLNGPRGRSIEVATCSCFVGGLPSNGSAFDCTQISCSTSADCERLTRNSYCKVWEDPSFNYCTCSSSFEAVGDRCVLKNIRRLGEHCTHLDDCGVHAQCPLMKQLKNCECIAGTRPGKNGVDCEWMPCSADADCQAVSKDLTCNLLLKRCHGSAAKGGGVALQMPSLMMLFAIMIVFLLKF